VTESARVFGERRRVSVYLVGGPVRDLALGNATTDLDLTMVGDAPLFAKALAAHLGARVTIHDRFGTASLILPDGLRLDVATARRESYAHPAALPDVAPGTIQEDLFRRDFTINAMAVRLAPQGEELLDPFGGLGDLRRCLLQALHEGSYRDDPTRIFRGARYAARYRFRFSRRDRRLIRDVLAENVLKRLSRDRLFHEVKLLLGEPRSDAALKVLEKLGVLRTLDPALALAPNTGAQMRRVRRAWERYHHLISPEPVLWRIYLFVLLLSVHPRVRRRVGQCLGMKGPPLDALVMELKELPGLQEKLDRRHLRASRLRQLLDRASGEMHLLIWATGGRRVRKRVDQYLTRLASVKPTLTGQDLQRLGFPPGPTYRRMLDLLLEGRLEGRLKSREQEVNFLQQRFGRPR
jgi:tRNA nucleotidyltransferase (CCA-adding enzyme)